MNEQLLVEANLGLVVSIARSFQPNDTDLYDFIQVGTIGLLRAIRQTTEKNFYEYARKWIRFEILHYVCKNNKKYDILTDFPDKERLNIKEYLSDDFTGKENRVINYYLMGYNFTEIGNLCGITRKTAKKYFNSAVEKCREN